QLLALHFSLADCRFTPYPATSVVFFPSPPVYLKLRAFPPGPSSDLAVPPLLSDSVGVPPATVTASLRFTVSVTTLPTPSVPLPEVIPAPEATTEDTVGPVLSICSVPDGLVTAPVRLAELPAPSFPVA